MGRDEHGEFLVAFTDEVWAARFLEQPECEGCQALRLSTLQDFVNLLEMLPAQNCLRVVFDVKQGKTWERPLPITEVLEAIRKRGTS
jgi:hypothetical protein